MHEEESPIDADLSDKTSATEEKKLANYHQSRQVPLPLEDIILSILGEKDVISKIAFIKKK